MLQLRPSAERGYADHGWLKARHTFSFANYFDRSQMGFRALRVINEDRVAPKMGFGEHAHNDMEILTYVLEGAIEHRDSLGHGEILRPGEVQYMRAGSGIRHSEFNPSADSPLHLLQIWLLPNQRGLTPDYAQRPFPIHSEPDRLHLVASTDGRGGSIPIHADAELYAATLTPGAAIKQPLQRFNNGWLQLVRGSMTANDVAMEAGDGLALTGEDTLSLHSAAGAEFLFFELA
jgi:redox-sensitive bicupin YhaK (pirin superfamily)